MAAVLGSARCRAGYLLAPGGVRGEYPVIAVAIAAKGAAPNWIR